MLFAQIRDQLPHVPGGRAAAASSPALLSGGQNPTRAYFQGRAKPTDSNRINRLVVAPNFFDTMGIRLTAGRGLTDRDTLAAPKVVVINDAAARKYFPRENPIGQHFGQSFETTSDMESIGVVKDAKYNSLRDEARPRRTCPT